MMAAVVGGAEDSDDSTTSETFEAVHDAFMRSYDHTKWGIGSEEVSDPVRPEFADFPTSIGIPGIVGDDA